MLRQGREFGGIGSEVDDLSCFVDSDDEVV